MVEKQVRNERDELRGAIIDIEGDQGFEGFPLKEALEILDGKGSGVLAAILGRAGDVGQEGDVGDAAERGILGQGFGFINIEADLEVMEPVTGDTNEGGFVDDGSATDIDEGAAGPDGAEEFLRDDVVVLGRVGGEFHDDVVLGEEVFKGRGAGDTVFLEDSVGNTGGEGGNGDIEGAEKGDHFLGDGPKAVESDTAAEEALGDGFHAVFPASVPVHGDVPVTGPAHRGKDKEEAAFRDRAADGVTPVGDEQAVLDELTGDELFHATGEVGDVAELAGFTDREIFRKRGTSPGAKNGFGLVLVENGFPGGGVGQREGERDLAEGEGIQLCLDGWREEVLALL